MGSPPLSYAQIIFDQLIGLMWVVLLPLHPTKPPLAPPPPWCSSSRVPPNSFIQPPIGHFVHYSHTHRLFNEDMKQIFLRNIEKSVPELNLCVTFVCLFLFFFFFFFPICLNLKKKKKMIIIISVSISSI